MAIIGIRDLVRRSKEILEQVETANEPFVITRHGQPVAALVPIASDEAERYLLAADPVLLADRREVEAAGPRRGRSLADIGRELEPAAESADEAGEREEQAQLIELDSDVAATLTDEVAGVLGPEWAHAFAERAFVEVEKVTTFALAEARQAGGEDAVEQATARITALNAELFAAKARGVLVDAVRTRTEVLAQAGAAGASEGLVGPTLVEDMVERTARYVDARNRSFVSAASDLGTPFSLGAYEASLKASIETLDWEVG